MASVEISGGSVCLGRGMNVYHDASGSRATVERSCAGDGSRLADFEITRWGGAR